MTQAILCVDDESFTRKLVATTLGKAGYQVHEIETGKQAVQAATEINPGLVILDETLPGMDGYEICRRLRSNPETAQTPIIILTANDTLETRIKSLHAGADDYLTKPFQPGELQTRVGRLIHRQEQMVPQSAQDLQGKVIAVFSLRGGVGVSSLAANLAAAQAQIWQTKTLLVDLSMVNGQSASMFNLPLRATWSELGTLSSEELSLEQIDDVLIDHPSGVRVLAAPRHPADAEMINADKVNRVLDLIDDQYDYIVLDMGHDFRDHTIAGLDHADEILVVLSPEIASLQAAATAVDVLHSLDYSDNNIHLVLNWIFPRRGLIRTNIEDVLKKKIDLVIPYEPDLFVTGINLGAPFILKPVQSSTGALLEDFAFYLSKEEHKKTRPDNPSGAWLRVADRFKRRAGS